MIRFFIKINLIVLLSVACTASHAQEVRVIDNKGTLETIRNNSVTTAIVAPNNPLEGDVWFDTSGPTRVTKTYDGTQWVSESTNVFTGFFIVTQSGIATITGIPFSPSQITFVAHTNVETLNLNADSGNGNNVRGINNAHGTMNGFARRNADNSVTQQVIFIGAHGNSINDISRFSSSSNCLGLRYGDQNGSSLGIIRGALSGFTNDGFTIDVTYVNGVVTNNSANPVLRVQPNDVQNEDVVVLFTAYK